jgi:hypothetical protein
MRASLLIVLAVGCAPSPTPRLAALPVPAAASSPPVPAAAEPRPGRTVREKHSVKVDGVRETWSLEWAGAVPSGIPETDQLTPVTGRFGDFGETGELFVVRARPGAPVEELALGTRMLPRWPVEKDDGDSMPAAEVMKRKEIPAVRFGDYDHDGNAAEFPLLVEIHPPGTFGEDRRTILVGLDRRTRRLGVLGDARHPDKPVTMNTWEPLLRANPAEIVQSGCGDHGRLYEKAYLVHGADDGLHVRVRSYDCTMIPGAGAERGKLLGETDWEPGDDIHGAYSNYFKP